MATEPGPSPGGHTPESDRLQQFYDESLQQATEPDEDSLFAELYGKQEDVRPAPAVSDSKPKESEAMKDEDDEDEESVSDESGSDEDDADQDVKIILMSSSDAGRPLGGRPAPNKYIRQDAAAAPAAAAATAAATTTITTSATPLMSIDGEMAGENHEPAADAQTKSSQRAIAKMIPEKPEPIDSNGHQITFPTVYDVDIDALPEKPWKNPMADLSDWFNYGFDEDSWRTYCQRQVQMRLSVTKPRKQKNFEAQQPQMQQQPPPQQQHHRKHGPITASVPPPYRPPQPISQDVLQLGGGSNFAEDPRQRHHRYDNKGPPPPVEHRAGPPPSPHHPERPPIPPARYKEAEPPNNDPKASRPPPRYPSPPRSDSAVRGRDDGSRSRFENARHPPERREGSSSRAYDKRGRPSPPPRDSHYRERERSHERDHRREHDRLYRDKRPRSPAPSAREYDSKRRR